MNEKKTQKRSCKFKKKGEKRGNLLGVSRQSNQNDGEAGKEKRKRELEQNLRWRLKKLPGDSRQGGRL